MGKFKLHFVLILILIISLTVLSFSTSEKENVLDYFINPNFGDINFRTFESSDSLTPGLIYKQSLSGDRKTDNGILLEYIFMNQDSVPLYGGSEKIKNNSIEILDQYIVVENRKLFVEMNKGEVWDLDQESIKEYSSELADEEIGYKIKSLITSYARFKDTLGEKSLIIESKAISTPIVNGDEFENMISMSKRIYVKYNGLVYTGQTTDGDSKNYFIIK